MRRALTSVCFVVALVGCGEPGDDGARLRDLRACDAPVCDPVGVECGGQPCAYDDAAICTLEGLRDQARGVYMQVDCEGACSGEIVHIAGIDRPVQRQSYYVEYVGSSMIETLGDIERCELRADAAAFFQACLDTPDTAACLRPSQWVTSCAPVDTPSCL